MSPSSLCRRERREAEWSQLPPRQLYVPHTAQSVQVSVYVTVILTWPLSLSTSSTVPHPPPLSLSSVPSLQRGQRPACPHGPVSSLSSPPVSAARPSVSASPRTAPSKHGSSPQPTHRWTHTHRLRIETDSTMQVPRPLAGSRTPTYIQPYCTCR